MNVLRNLKPESSDTREETVHDSDRIWLEVNRKSAKHSCSGHPPVIFGSAYLQSMDFHVRDWCNRVTSGLYALRYTYWGLQMMILGLTMG